MLILTHPTSCSFFLLKREKRTHTKKITHKAPFPQTKQQPKSPQGACFVLAPPPEHEACPMLCYSTEENWLSPFQQVSVAK